MDLRRDPAKLDLADSDTVPPIKESKREWKPGRRRATELDGRTWQRYSISIWNDIRKTSEEIRLGHPAIFPLELVMRVIQCFTNSQDKIVLDPFSGMGSTPIAAELLGKTGIGIELSEEYAVKSRARIIPVHSEFDYEEGRQVKAINGIELAESPGSRVIIQDDALNLMEHVEPETADLVITSPPYWDILLQERSADQKEVRNYGNDELDLGRIRDYTRFLDGLGAIFARVHEALRPGKYCIIIVMDIRKKDTFYPFHSDLAQRMEQLGFIYDDLIIWDRRHEYNNLRPLGYPSKFRINKVHEFILIFQKPV